MFLSALAREELIGTYTHPNAEAEWIVHVRWNSTRDAGDAVWEKGMFANQNRACKLCRANPIRQLKQAFGEQD